MPPRPNGIFTGIRATEDLDDTYFNVERGETMPATGGHRFAVGDYVQVTGNMGGHNYEIGTTGRIITLNGDRTCQIQRDSDGTIGNWALTADCALLDMARQAQAARAKKEYEALEKKFMAAKKKHESLSKFESDEEEFADALARILKTDVDSTVVTKTLKKLGYSLVRK